MPIIALIILIIAIIAIVALLGSILGFFFSLFFKIALPLLLILFVIGIIFGGRQNKHRMPSSDAWRKGSPADDRTDQETQPTDSTGRKQARDVKVEDINKKDDKS